MYSPLFQSSVDADMSVAFTNPTLTSVDVTITARDYAGALIAGSGITNPVIITLPPSGQRTYLIEDMFGSAISGRTGWMTASTASGAVTGLFHVFDSQVRYLDGASWVAQTQSRLIFPRVSIDSGNATTLSFVNTGSVTLTGMQLSLYDNNGALVRRQFMDLAPLTGFSGLVTALLTPQITSFTGYAVLETADASGNVSGPLVGVESYRKAADNGLLNAGPDALPVRTGYFPHVVTFGGYYSSLGIVNPTAETQVVQISAVLAPTLFLDASAAPMSVTRTIPANGRIEERLDSMFQLTGTAMMNGWVSFNVQGNTSGVVAYLEYASTDDVLLSSVPAHTAAASDYIFSNLMEGNGYYTGIAVLNTREQTTQVSVEMISQEGVRLATAVLDLESGDRKAFVIGDVFPNVSGRPAFVRVSASQPVFAIQLYGARALNFLANDPGQGVNLTTQSTGGVVRVTEGASVVSTDGSIAVLLRPDALGADSTISVRSVDIATLPAAPTGRTLVSALEATPSGFQAQIPIKLFFPIGVRLTAGTELAMLVLNTATNQFDDSGFVAVVAESGRMAVASVTHFSIYAVSVADNELVALASVLPSSGAAGSTVTLQGTGFSADPDSNTVTFEGPGNISVDAVVNSASATSLTVTVPADAVSGKVIVQVGSKSSKGIRFDVIPQNLQPTISSLSPSTLAVGMTAANVQIVGSRFLTSSKVVYDGVEIPSSYSSPSLLAVALSGSQLSNGTHSILVRHPANSGGDSNTVSLQITNPVPVITGLSPASATVPATLVVTINGTGFTSASSVLVNNAAVSTTFVSSTQVRASLTATTAQNTSIKVSNPTPGGGTSNEAFFAFLAAGSGPAPTVTSVTPSAGAQGTTFSSTLVGTNLTGATAVTISGSGVTAIIGSGGTATSIPLTITITSGAAVGARNVTVTTPGGSGTRILGLTVNAPAPTVTGMTPATGIQGTSFAATIAGTNLTAATSVTFSGGGVTAVIGSGGTATSRPVTVTITSGAALGARDVTVNTPGGTATRTGGLTVNPTAPTLTTITPSSSAQGTTLSATIAGTSLAGATSVTFSGSGVTATIGSGGTSTSLPVTVAITSGAATGTRNVSVTTPGGTVTKTAAFTVNAAALPTITTINPASGTQGTSVSATITGTNLSGASSITFSGTGVTAAVGSGGTATSLPLTITITGGAATGARNFTITATGGSVTRTAGFTVNASTAAPTVTSIAPASGIQGNAVSATITGTNLSGATAVSFSGSGVTAVIGSGGTGTSLPVTVTITSGAATGARNVTVTTPGGATTATAAFTVNTSSVTPTVTSITPASGSQGANVSATISGTNLSGATSVVIGGTGVTAAIGSGGTATSLPVTLTITSGAATGARNVTVTTPGGTATQTNGFTVNSSTTPSGNVYYVDNTGGSDSNNGTSPSTPWKSSPGMTAYSGSKSLIPGDTVYFDRADTWLVTGQYGIHVEGGVTYIGDSWGTGTSRAIIRANADLSAAVIDFREDHPTIPTVVKGFEVDANSRVVNGVGFNMPFYSNPLTGAVKRVENLNVHHTWSRVSLGQYTYGISVSNHGGTAATVSNVEILNSVVHDTSRDGIVVYPGDENANCIVSNVTVRGNEVYNTGQDPDYGAGSGIIVKGRVIDAFIENNYVHDTKASGLFINGNETNHYGFGPTNIHLRYNIIRVNNNFGAILLYDGSSGADPKDVRIYGNIIYNATTNGGLLMDTSLRGANTLRVYNNTFYNAPVIINTTSATFPVFEFKNNIVYYPGGTPITGSNRFTSSSNNVTTNPNFKNTGNLPTGFVGTYPNLTPNTDGLSLLPGSNAIDAGVTLGAPYNSSINSVVRPSGSVFDVGAYE